MHIVPFAEGQDQFAQEIEALSDDEAKDAYGALVSFVHQMRRMKAKLGKPVAIEEIEIFVKSFEEYVNRLDSLSAAELQLDYELGRRSAVGDHAAPNLRHGAQALMVIILGEMIRRQDDVPPEQRMSGYRRAHRMLERLERSLAP